MGKEAKKTGLRKNSNQKFKGKPEKNRIFKKKEAGYKAGDYLEQEDIEVEKVIPVSKMEASSGKKGSIHKHRDELQSLKDTDPEFFNYLKENDAELLDFGQGEEDDEEDEVESDLEEEEDEDEEDQPKSTLKVTHRSGKTEVTKALVNSLIKKATDKTSPSLISLKKLLSMFRVACVPHGDGKKKDEDGDDDDDDDEDMEEGGMSAGSTKSRFVISSPEVYQYVMTRVLDNAFKAFYRLLSLSDFSSPSRVEEHISKHPKWKRLLPLALSLFRSLHHTLSSLSTNLSQGEVTVYLINSLENYIPLLSSLPRMGRNILKVLLNLWAMDLPPAEDSQNIRGHAFLRVRQMALHLPKTMCEEAFRSIYLFFARTAKTYSELTAPSVNFMIQCIVELYRFDPVQSYQQSFLYIRQLALHLRAAILKGSAETTRQVTSWQYLNCLRVWTQVICSSMTSSSSSVASSSSGMGELVFPLCQIMSGVLSMSSSIYFCPLKFHVMILMQQLAAATGSFVPTASKVLEMFEHPDLYSKPIPSTDLTPNFLYLVKLPNNSIGKIVVRDGVFQQMIALLSQEIEIYRYHVGFPEYSYLIIRKLKTFSKKCKIAKWRESTRSVISRIESSASYVKSARSKLGKSPLDLIQSMMHEKDSSSSSSLSSTTTTTGSSSSSSSSGMLRTSLDLLLPPGESEVAAVRLGKLIGRRGESETGSGSGSSLSVGKKQSKNGGKFGKRMQEEYDGEEEEEDEEEDDDDEEEEEDNEMEEEPVPTSNKKQQRKQKQNGKPSLTQKKQQQNQGGKVISKGKAGEEVEDVVENFDWSDEEN